MTDTEKFHSFSDLWPGDRFIANGELWSKLDDKLARKHSKASQSLGPKGAGYLGDPICSFEPTDIVIFQPVN